MAAAKPTIHASAVLVGAKAALIRGPSGSGKSRLAWSLVTAATEGLLRFARLVCRRPHTPRKPFGTAARASSASAGRHGRDPRPGHPADRIRAGRRRRTGRRSRGRRRRPEPHGKRRQHYNRRNYPSASWGCSGNGAVAPGLGGLAYPPSGSLTHVWQLATPAHSI